MAVGKQRWILYANANSDGLLYYDPQSVQRVGSKRWKVWTQSKDSNGVRQTCQDLYDGKNRTIVALFITDKKNNPGFVPPYEVRPILPESTGESLLLILERKYP
jgi:hypothetical protein